MRLFVFLMVCVAAGLTGCGKGGTAATQPSGGAATTAAATQPLVPRIASAVPAATLNLVLLGNADTLVGVSNLDKVILPASQKGLPVIGDYQGIDYEELLRLKPTAVIIQRAESRVWPRLRELSESQHFEIVNLKLETTDDLWAMVKTLGRVTGRQASADAAIVRAQGELKEVADSLKGKPRPKVVYVVGKNPLMVVGSNTFLDEMITMAGGENVGAAVGRSWLVISTESLVKLAPDVLLVGAPDEADQQVDDVRVKYWDRFAIPAVREHRVFLVTDGDSQMSSIDFPRGVKALADLIHRQPASATQPGAAP